MAGCVRIGVVMVLVWGLFGCGASAGGGGSFAASGGAPGTGCNTQFQDQGCFAGQRVQCQGGTGAATWATLDTCPSGSYCAEDLEPGGGAKKLATCKGSVASDVGCVGCGDGGPGADGVLVSDAGLPDAGNFPDSQMPDSQIPDSQPVDVPIPPPDVPVAPMDVPVAPVDVPIVQDVTPFDAGKADVSAPCDPAKQFGKCGAGGTMFACDSGKWVQVDPCPPGSQCVEGPVLGSKTIMASCESPCGNGTCESGETPNSCPSDCTPPEPVGNAGCGGGQDAMFLQLFLGQPSMTAQLYDLLASCVKTDCVGTPPGAARIACVATCAAGKFNPGLPLPIKLSDNCYQCFGGLADCSASLCPNQCLADANAAPCQQCQVDQGCQAAFAACKTKIPATP